METSSANAPVRVKRKAAMEPTVYQELLKLLELIVDLVEKELCSKEHLEKTLPKMEGVNIPKEKVTSKLPSVFWVTTSRTGEEKGAPEGDVVVTGLGALSVWQSLQGKNQFYLVNELEVSLNWKAYFMAQGLKPHITLFSSGSHPPGAHIGDDRIWSLAIAANSIRAGKPGKTGKKEWVTLSPQGSLLDKALFSPFQFLRMKPNGEMSIVPKEGISSENFYNEIRKMLLSKLAQGEKILDQPDKAEE